MPVSSHPSGTTDIAVPDRVHAALVTQLGAYIAVPPTMAKAFWGGEVRTGVLRRPDRSMCGHYAAGRCGTQLRLCPVQRCAYADPTAIESLPPVTIRYGH